MKVGYLIPEFPSQTHIFFWREKAALEKLGVRVGLVSTRRPGERLAPHPWSAEAIAQTAYLFPPRLRAIGGAGAELLRAGPRGWWRCIAAAARADGCSAYGRLRLLLLACMGGQLAWLARRGGWSHVHVHSCADCANIAMFAFLLSGLSYSMMLHGPLEHYGPNQRLKWRLARFAVVVTQKLLSEVRQALAGHLPETVEVAPMGVDTTTFQRRVPYVPWSGGPFSVFSCSRLNPGKGHDDLIRAIAILRDRGIDARLRIAGEDDSRAGACRRGLERLIGELSLDENVLLLGAVPEDVVRSELEMAHAFALASHNEALGVATMEAMAMRLPVAVTRVGGVAELVEDGVDGLLVDARQPAQLADAIAWIASDAALARRLGEAAGRKIAERFHSGLSAGLIARCLEVERAAELSPKQ